MARQSQLECPNCGRNTFNENDAGVRICVSCNHSEDTRKCPNCFQKNWEYTSQNPAATMCRCNDCGNEFPAHDAVKDDGTGHEDGFHDDPKSWSK